MHWREGTPPLTLARTSGRAQLCSLGNPHAALGTSYLQGKALKETGPVTSTATGSQNPSENLERALLTESQLGTQRILTSTRSLMFCPKTNLLLDASALFVESSTLEEQTKPRQKV